MRFINNKTFRPFLLTIFITTVGFNGWAQRISINKDNITLRSAFEVIEDLTEYRIIYNQTKLDVDKRVNLNYTNTDIFTIINHLLKDSNHGFKTERNYIVIYELKDTPSPGILENTVSGKVIDEKGEPVPGAAIRIKGTQTGTIADNEGFFTINAYEGQVIEISHIAYSSKTIVIEKNNELLIILKERALSIDEIVVTALGIRRNKRALAYSTEQVNTSGLQTVKTINLAESLQGKIAGLNIINGSAGKGVGADVHIDIRGNRSINGNNQPLIVIDGVPGGSLSGLSPDNLESVNVLKGATAAALYGSEANNGVIVVTTKKGQEGKTKIEVNSTTIFDFISAMPPLQNVYAQGQDGIYYVNQGNSSWGPKMEGQAVKNFHGEDVRLDPQPNNARDVFRTGLNAQNSLTLSGGSKIAMYYFSYLNTTAKGPIQNNDLQRQDLNLRLNLELLKNVSIELKSTYNITSIASTPVEGDDVFSPMQEILKMPRSIRTADIQEPTYLNAAGETKQNTWAPNDIGVYNPYFAIIGRKAPTTRSTQTTLASVKWDILPYLFIQGRGSYTGNNNDYETKIMWDAPYTWNGKGEYETGFGKSRILRSDVLLGFDKKFGGFNINANLGAEVKDVYARNMKSNSGALKSENKFFLGNGSQITSDDRESRVQRQSIYGTGQVNFRNMLFLDVTARRDWSSTLPSPFTYFYPSFGLSAIVSDMVKLPEAISFAKLRSSWAEVGNDIGFASIYQTFTRQAMFPLGGIKFSSTRVPVDVKPERTRSIEVGGEIRFFGNRLGIDATWYKSNSFDQLISITAAPTSGFTNSLVNCGNIQNKGVEIMLSGTPIRNGNFKWDININFAKNDNVVKELIAGTPYVQVSTPSMALGRALVKVGEPYGQLYDYGFVRNANGDVVVNATSGLPTLSNDPLNKYLGNQNYDWKAGMVNTLVYKGWDLNFLIDINKGGVRQSSSDCRMMYMGTSIASLEGRETGRTFPGVLDNGDGTYRPNDKVVNAQAYAYSKSITGNGGRDGAAELYSYSATNSRLRECSLGYNLNRPGKKLPDIHFSLVGRNLFYFYNGCKWFDPDQSANPNTNGQGSESSFLPQTTSFGVNIKATF